MEQLARDAAVAQLRRPNQRAQIAGSNLHTRHENAPGAALREPMGERKRLPIVD